MSDTVTANFHMEVLVTVSLVFFLVLPEVNMYDILIKSEWYDR